MNGSDLLKSSLESLSRTKARAVLTMLGIVIGVMAVILMLSIGEAAQRYIVAQVSSFGSDVLFVANGPSTQSGQPTLFIKQSLTMTDVKKLQSTPWVTQITGLVRQQDQLTANGLDTNVTVVGTMPDELLLNDVTVGQGSFFPSSSVDGHAREAVLGFSIADKAFGAEDPLGRIIKISGQGFKVVGVMQPAGTKSFQNVDKQVYIPVTAALDLYNKQYLDQITLRSSLPLADAKPHVEAILRDRHNIDNPTGDLTKDDFHLQTQEDLIKSANQITDILKILLISIAAISLLVGGIGIMNIMYVVVTERIREIGLRKSLGARPPDILKQFLLEATLQTSLGGCIGGALGIFFSWLAIKLISLFQAGWTFGISWSGVILGIGVSALIGMLFGYLPARRAAQLNPIDALRFE